MNHHIKEKIAEYIFLAVALSSVLAVVLISVFIFAGGMPAIKEIGITDFVFGTKWKPTAAAPYYGVAPMIVGSLLITLGAVAIGVPMGIFSAVFLSDFCPDRLH